MNQHTMSDAEVVSTGHINALKIITTTVENAVGSDELGLLKYKIEAQDCQRLCFGRTNAKSVTLSFWAKSKVAGDYAVSLYQPDGGEIIGNKYTLVADTWKKIEMTFAGNTGANIVNDNGEGLAINWTLIATSGGDFATGNNTSWSTYADNKLAYGHNVTWGTNTSHDFYLTGVQLELGSNATPFEHRSYADELARCERYFQTSYSDGVAIGAASRLSSLVDYNVRNSLSSSGGTQFPTTMCYAPTVTLYDSVAGGGGIYNNGTKTSYATYIGTGGFESQSITSGVAENVHFHYTALAEL